MFGFLKAKKKEKNEDRDVRRNVTRNRELPLDNTEVSLTRAVMQNDSVGGTKRHRLLNIIKNLDSGNAIGILDKVNPEKFPYISEDLMTKLEKIAEMCLLSKMDIRKVNSIKIDDEKRKLLKKASTISPKGR